ncbi:MAG: hypothetical protein GC154_05210 [bacterium]|nr:hypothetical protein [bacterium]
MMPIRLRLAAAVFAAMMLSLVTHGADYPSVTLNNGSLEMLLYPPDAASGYYRGSRFEWSGVIQQVKYAGYTVFGDWKATHDPRNHDDVNGPVGEFGMKTPLGYTDASVGGPFLKIGIGLLTKKDRNAYSFAGNHALKQVYDWSVEHGDDWIAYRQDAPDFNGWKYEYVKRIELESGSPVFTISHQLKNTGEKPIDTDYYCHNFTILDDEPIGPSYELTFSFTPQFTQSFNGYARAEGNKIIFLKALKNTSTYVEFTGYPVTPESTRVTIHNKNAGVALKIEGDYPAYDFHFWSTTLATCPEPFIKIDLAPGESMEWTDRYTVAADSKIEDDMR